MNSDREIPNLHHPDCKDVQKAGTGFMLQPAEAIHELSEEGYDQNIVPRFDHFEVGMGEKKIFPSDFRVDMIIRFENASDPDDQSILYAITSAKHGVKGLFVESFGLYHEDLSEEMLSRLTQDAA